MSYEYKVVPAPTRGEKAKGVKGNEARFAHTVETLMNEMAGDGWEYQRAETLPSEERQGLTSTTTVWRTMLVFRRAAAAEAAEPRLLDAPRREPGPMRPEAKATPTPPPVEAAPEDPAPVPGPAPEKPDAPEDGSDGPRRAEPVTNLSEVLRTPGRIGIGRKDG